MAKAIYLPSMSTVLPPISSRRRESDRFMGINVTVPHKLRIMDSDDLTPRGRFAVNTVANPPVNRYNTDGEASSKASHPATDGM
jgi:shikimate 5-dehydrogenase